MPTLSSILVQRGAASMRTVEDAIARQVFHGGDLATNLLELGGVREDVLVPLVAESLGLPPAPVGSLPAPSADVLRRVPGELALRHGIFPLELADRTLVIAVAEPLANAVEDDLGFALDVALRQVAAPLVRIRAAIAYAYGIPLDRRLSRLHAKLSGNADPSPSAIPPPEHNLLPERMPRPVSIPVPTFGTGVPDSVPARLDARPAPKAPFAHLAQDLVNPAIPRSPILPAIAGDDEGPVARDAPAPITPTPPASPVRVLEAPAPTAPSQEAGALGLAGTPTSMQTAETLPGPPPAARGEGPAEPGKQAKATRALAGVLRDALREERTVDKRRADPRPRWRGASPRRKGPFTTARAEQELEESSASDEVLEVVFAFAHQFFEYAALFVVHGELLEGRDAAGPGADRAKISGIGVSLDLPSSLATARETRAPLLAPPSTTGLDADLLRDLGRALRDKARVAAFLPVVVRGRTVAVLFGDDGSTDVELAAIGDVLAVIGLAGAALERIALRKKLGSRAPEVALKVRAKDGAAALARAMVGTAGGLIPARSPSATQASMSAVVPFDDTPQGIRFAEDETPAPVAIASGAPQDAPPAARHDSWIPVVSVGESPAGDVPNPIPHTTRRGVAPLYEGRAAAVPDGAEVAWVSGPNMPDAMGTPAGPRREARRTLPSMGLGPLPVTPPPNAVTSFPSNPPGPLRSQAPGPALSPSVPPAQSSTSKPPTAQRSIRPLPRDEDPEPPPPPRVSSRPPPRHSSNPPRHPAREVLPSVMVDLAAEHRELIQRVVDGGQRGQEAFDALVKSGELVVQAVMARFPGPLRVDRHRARGELPAASQCGPILELVVAIRRPALPFVSVRSSAHDPEVRFWATHTLGELRYPEAASVLVPRLFDDDAQVRRIARRSAAALVGAGAAGAPLLKGLEDITANPDQPKLHRIVAIETMGEIRSGSLVGPLLVALEDPSEDVGDAARRALLLIARQDFGHDVERWRDWWERNAGRHRIEWLIDALMHDQPSVRRAAGDELKLLTKEYFGYYDDLPRRDRERAQGLYRTWWDREGRRRFA
jgi:hypothetical protein